MDELKARIQSEGKVLPGNIIKVGSFLNHRIDTALLGRMADEFAKHFDISKISLILTIEASGIALATACSYKWGIPMLFAKKAKTSSGTEVPISLFLPSKIPKRKFSSAGAISTTNP